MCFLTSLPLSLQDEAPLLNLLPLLCQHPAAVAVSLYLPPLAAGRGPAAKYILPLLCQHPVAVTVYCPSLPFLQDEAPLLNPNVLICSVGTEIFYRTADGSLVPDQAWEAYLDQGWDRAAVEAVAAKFPQLKQQVCVA